MDDKEAYRSLVRYFAEHADDNEGSWQKVTYTSDQILTLVKLFFIDGRTYNKPKVMAQDNGHGTKMRRPCNPPKPGGYAD